MVDKSKRYVRTYVPLAEVPQLTGRKLDFENIAEMFLTRVRERPDDPLVYFYDEVITYAQVNDRANAVANYLKGKGVKKGDIISVMVLNAPEIYYTMFGAQKLGSVTGAVNYMLKGPEIAYVLEDSRPSVAFVGSEYMEEFAKGLRLSAHKPVVVEVVTDAQHAETIAETTLDEILRTFPPDECLVPQAADDPVMLMYSSGTTGMPKGILLSHRNELCICKGSAIFGRSEPGDVFMIVLPMFHVNPLCVWTYPIIYQGLSVCIRKSFSPKDFWPAILRYGVTTVQGVPAMFSYVYNAIDPASIDFSRMKLRMAFTGAAPMPVELIHGFKEKFGIEVVDGYGLTEATGVSTTCSGIPENIGSIGMAYPGLEVEIMDDDNNILPYGERGEICVRGDAVMIGYLNKPEATAESLRDGWLHTGDMGHMDELGYVYISGRKKEMINRGGENIYPREIEIPLEQHPKIAEAAVVGAPDPALGERVRACIILQDGCTMTDEEVRDYLADKLAKYKLPEFVEFMADFPRNPTGKILKKELKKRFSGEEKGSKT
ncbi:MAG: long-chain-fatty-acid--CoA ligase [Smithellaceae bacterium]|nr:long-chain-fatty-acid--CoA ligase [Syntrophaceae bacterium]MDD4240839.1 long-chain-fatty-acid--CoA ligase [Smithellaceae bacterium]